MVVITSVVLVLIAGFSFLNVPYFIVGIIATFFLGFILGAFTHSMLTPQEPKSKPKPKPKTAPAPPPPKPEPTLTFKGTYRYDYFDCPYVGEAPKDEKTEPHVNEIHTPLCPKCKLEAIVNEGWDEEGEKIEVNINCPNADVRGSGCKKQLYWEGSLGDLHNRIRIYIEGAIRKGDIDPYATARWIPKPITLNIFKPKG